MAAHRYWRLLISAIDGSAYVGFAEIELRESIGGADATGNGTASASGEGNGAASNAVDGNLATFWQNGAEALPQWWKYDFGVVIPASGVAEGGNRVRVKAYGIGA